MQTWAQVLHSITPKLREVVGETAVKDARLLLAHALEITADRVVMVLPDIADITQQKLFINLIEARLNHQPVAQIIGKRVFWDREFIVTPDVLDPRPETESLIALALEGPQPDRILDLGVGSGCILLTLLAGWGQATGVGADISTAALDVARRNASALKLLDRASFEQSNWYDTIEGRFDLVVSNPPYISAAEMQGLDADVRDWEPRIALTPEGDGLDAYRKLAQDLDRFLTADGCALFEIGFSQGRNVQRLFENAGFRHVSVERDMNGHERFVTVKR